MATMKPQQCYEDNVLERMLSEQLVEQEEAALLDHLSSCESCRGRLEHMTGNVDFEPELREHLDPESFDKLAPTFVLGEEPQATDVEQVKRLLGPTDDPQMLGRLGHYEVCAMVGQGSTGVVFKAFDGRLNRYVAIKMLAPAYAGSGAARKRFEREGFSIASVRDEHVIPVFSVDEHAGLPYIVMEYMPGGALAQRIDQSGPLDSCTVVRIAMQIATGLAEAHKQGIIHRDVKPANVLLEGGVDRAVVTDFGLARIPDEVSMTRSGVISGTPQFMSPEQAKGEEVDHRSDLFSLGSVMYTACTGHSPFRSETVFGVIKRVCDTDPRPILETNPKVEPWLCDFIAKLHSKDKELRFQSAREVASLLEEELAYMQNPAQVAKPERQWRVKPKRNWPTKRIAAALALALFTLTGACLLLDWSLGDKRVSRFINLSSQEQLAGASAFAPGQWSKQQLEFRFADANTKLAAGQVGGRVENDFTEGEADFDSGRYEESIAHFQLAADGGRYGGKAAYNIACAYAKLERADEALAWLNKAQEAGFVDAKHYRSDEDLSYLRDDPRFEELIVGLESMEKSERLLNKAMRLRQAGDLEEAAEELKRALKLQPDSPSIALEYGFVLHMLGRLEDALPWHKIAAESECCDHYGNYNVACYHALKGKKDQAFKFLERAIQAGIDDVSLLESDSDLDSIRSDPRFDAIMDEVLAEVYVDWSEEERECHRLILALERKDYDQLSKLLADVSDLQHSCPDVRIKRWGGDQPRTSVMVRAIELGEMEAVKLLVDAEYELDKVQGRVATPLMAAAKAGRSEMVEFLADHGADVRLSIPRIGSPLTMAVQAPKAKETLELLLNKGADVDEVVREIGTALMVAAGQGEAEVSTWLIDQQADVNVVVPKLGSALTVAVERGDADLVSLLIERGAKVDRSVAAVGTPLIVAVRDGHAKIIDMLLEEGADIDASVPGVGTALSVATAAGDMQVMQKLLDKGASVDQLTPALGSALGMASRTGRIEAARLLLKADANPDGTAAGMPSPLEIAVERKDPAMVRLLLQHGANPRREARGAKSAIDIGMERGGETVLQLLLNEMQQRDASSQ